MVAFIGFVVFASALLAATGTIAAMILPQWQRIAALMAGHVEPEFQPLSTLARAERRIAVRRWAGQRVPAAMRRSRAVA